MDIVTKSKKRVARGKLTNNLQRWLEHLFALGAGVFCFYGAVPGSAIVVICGILVAIVEVRCITRAQNRILTELTLIVEESNQITLKDRELYKQLIAHLDRLIGIDPDRAEPKENEL